MKELDNVSVMQRELSVQHDQFRLRTDGMIAELQDHNKARVVTDDALQQSVKRALQELDNQKSQHDLAIKQLAQTLDKEKQDQNSTTQQLVGASQQTIAGEIENLRNLLEKETENRQLLVRSLGDSHAESQELLKEVVLAKATELHEKVEEEARQRNRLQEEISSVHRSIYEKLNEHSAVALDLQRPVEKNERSMREKFNDEYSPQQSVNEYTLRFAKNHKSVDERVHNLTIGRFATTNRTTATLEEVQTPMPTMNLQTPMMLGSPIVQIRPVTASSATALTYTVPPCVPVDLNR